MNSAGIKPFVIPLWPMRVRLTGVARQDSSGQEIASLNTPTVAEATAALDRLARVSGADGIVNLGSDYRRTALAAGPLSTQWRIEVQAWGTAVRKSTERPEQEDDGMKG